jgi:hypothetical protein
MASGSYNSGQNGSFNPASYTRHFLGSPMSFRSTAGSYNGRLLGYPSSVGSVTMGSPLDMHRDPAVSNALKLFEFQDELCRNYTCCGVQLTDLHALLEHFEDVHVVCVDQPGGGGPQTRISIPFEPQIVDAGGVPQPLPSSQLQSQQQSQQQSMHQGGGPVDPDDMELEMPPPSSNTSSASSPTSTPSPPETLLATPLSTYSSPMIHSSLAAAYPGGYPGISTQKSSTSTSTSTSSSPSGSNVSTTNHSSQNSNSSSDSSSTERPNLVLNLSGFSSSTSRPTLHSPFITGPPPAGAWSSHGAPGGVDMTYMGNISVNGGLGMGGNFDYQNAYGYSFPHAPEADTISDDAGDMGCVQPAMLFSTPSSPQSHQDDRDDDDADADAEFDIDIEEPEVFQIAGDAQNEGKKEKTAKSSLKASNAKDPGAGSSATVSMPSNLGASETVANKAKSAPRIGRPPTTGGGSGLLQSKPFKCPKPNCNKSYKQANGLKYHLTHGSCNFAPPKDLEHVQAILERKRKQQQQQQNLEDSTSVASSGANTPRSGMATPVTPSSLNSPYSLSVNTGLAPGGSNSSSTVSSPVATTSSYTPTPSSLSTALSTALSLSSPTSTTSGFTETAYQDGESLSRSNSYGHRPNTTSNISSSLINALTPIPSASNTTSPSTSSNANSDNNDSTAQSLTSVRSTLSSLPASERLAIEAEAERQLKPYACGVGDCTRRYKNMNGLRYHYQHSGEHGAIGLSWLASGKHECLAQRGDKGTSKSRGLIVGTGPAVGSAYPSAGRVGGAEREGRKVRGAGGSSSKPTSRASSISRTGTPVNSTFPPLPFASQGAQGEVSAYQPTSPFNTQALSSPQSQGPALQYQQTQQFSSQPQSTHSNYTPQMGYPP